MLTFRRLTRDEEESGYRLLVDSVAWQKAKAIRLWHSPLPREVYAARQVRGENFGLFERDGAASMRGVLVAVVSLLRGIPELWHEHVSAAGAPWLATLAVAGHAHGRRVGRRALEEACVFLASECEGVLYLDCAKGFLETFYRDHGFRPLAEGLLCNASTDERFPAVLMAYALVSKGPEPTKP